MYTENQKFELNAVGLFQKAGGLPTSCDLLPGADPPDVVAHDGECRIGVEVRRLYADEKKKGGSPDRRRFSLCEAVVSHASRMHGAVSDRWYHITVYFNSSLVIHDKRVLEIAEALVDRVNRQPVQFGDEFEIRSEEHWGTGWPEEVLLVTGSLLEGDGAPFWGFGDSAWVGKTNADLIQEGIDSKEGRVCSIGTEIDERWLLMVLDGRVGSSMLEFHAEIEEERFRSSFGRVFIMGFNGRDYVELHVTA